jgi:hypothetical protein
MGAELLPFGDVHLISLLSDFFGPNHPPISVEEGKVNDPLGGVVFLTLLHHDLLAITTCLVAVVDFEV